MSEEEPKVTPPPKTAAGRHAIEEALKQVFSKAGVVRGSRGLLHLNQKGGVDCQSCAWPDPEHRTINEFCESGAKAFADDAMTEKIGKFDSKALAAALHGAKISAKDNPGVLLDVSFDQKGDLDRESFIVKVVGGKQQVIATVPPIGAK